MSLDFEIAPVDPSGEIPADALCQEASPQSRGHYIACGRPAAAIVFHDKDGRGYYMCESCTAHNTRNRGGVVVSRRMRSAPPITVLLEPESRPTHDDERGTLLAIALPDDIISPIEYTAIAEDRKRIKAFIDRVKPEFDKVCAAAKKAHDDACRLRAMFFDRLETMWTVSGQMLKRYDDKQEAARRAEERRLADEEFERQRRARNEEAALLKKQGQPDMAAALRRQEIVAPAVVLPRTTPKVEGLTFRDNWKWRPIGGNSPENRARTVALMVPAQYRQYVTLNDTVLTALARSSKGAIKVPGVEFYNDRIPVQR
jgi:hypothetical protein